MAVALKVFGIDLVAVTLITLSIMLAMLIILFIGYSKLRNLPPKFPSIRAQIIDNLKRKAKKRTSKVNYARLQEESIMDIESVMNTSKRDNNEPSIKKEQLSVIIDEILHVNCQP